jgi:hypothetical protein
MSLEIKSSLLEEINEKYNKIISNYKNIKFNIQNIYNDIKKLEGVHNVYINSNDLSSLNSSIYVDDIKHQINVTEIEYEYVEKIYNKNLDKFYRDLFKLYNRITKLLLTVYRENRHIIIKIWNSHEKITYNSDDFKKLKKSIKLIADSARTSININTDDKIFDEIRRYFYRDIIIYNELYNKQNIDLENIVKLFDLLKLRLDELKYSKEFISINLDDIQHKTDKGILGQTFIMDLYGKNNRIIVDYNILITILESIINMQMSISEKYNNFSQIIAEQVNYDDETSESLPENLSQRFSRRKTINIIKPENYILEENGFDSDSK